MNKEMKELDETMEYLWLIGHISDDAKLYWNDLVAKILTEGEGNE
jgi:hypothetical protein